MEFPELTEFICFSFEFTNLWTMKIVISNNQFANLFFSLFLIFSL